MKKKEILIILFLTLLLTGGVSFAAFNPCRTCRDAFYVFGWPLVFYRTGGFFGVTQWFWSNLVLDFFFWFLVSASIWFIFKRLRKRGEIKSV